MNEWVTVLVKCSNILPELLEYMSGLLTRVGEAQSYTPIPIVRW